MEYKNLKISGKNGKMYESSKEEKEGYSKVTYGEKNEKVTYHKYIDKIEGKFAGFGISQMNSDVANITMLNVKIQGENILYTISVPLKTGYGGVSDASKALISAFYGAIPNHSYSVTAFTKQNEKNNKTYDNQVVYVNSLTTMGENGKGLSTGFIPFNEIPRAKREDDGLGGVTYDNKEVNLFYGSKIKEISSKFEQVPSGEHTPQKESEPHVNEEEDDDLPF